MTKDILSFPLSTCLTAAELSLSLEVTNWTQKVSEGANWMTFEACMIGKACTPKQLPHSLEKTR